MNLSSWLHGFFGSRKPQDDEALQEEYGRRDLGEEELDREGVPGQDTAGADVADGVLDEFKAPPDPNP